MNKPSSDPKPLPFEDEVLRRMLASPPQPHKPLGAKPAPLKKAPKKK